MLDYYLRIDAVNLSNFVYDTNDLSTIRGGGLICLNWPKAFLPDQVSPVNVKLGDKFADWPEGGAPIPITQGASNAIFSFKAKDETAAACVRDAALKYFRDNNRFHYMTFVADVVRADGAFDMAREQLLALNRFRQLQQPTLVIPQVNEKVAVPADTHPYCWIDGVRAADTKTNAAANVEKCVCKSVDIRREYGRDQKRRLYAMGVPDANAEASTFFPARDFDRLTVRGEQRTALDKKILGNADPFSRLAGKMAVIYVDGNSFGDLERKQCKDVPSQRAFDAYLRDERKKLMDALRSKIQADPAWQVEPTDKVNPNVFHRIETLMWGGDELIWVVPAWRAWDTIQLFFEQTKNWKFNDQVMTHAMGVVLCSHKAPIAGVVRLARALAETCKAIHRNRDLLAYQVLESFDSFAGQDADAVRDRLTPIDVTKEHLIVAAKVARVVEVPSELSPSETILDVMKAFVEQLRKMRGDGKDDETFPRRKLFKLMAAQQRGGRNGDAYKEVIDRLEQEQKKLVTEWHEALQGMVPAMVYHLLEWWDYLPPEKYCTGTVAAAAGVKDANKTQAAGVSHA